MLTSKDFFYCYDRDLSKYLYERGFRYIHKAKEIRTNSIFSAYYITEQLSQALKEYKSNEAN